MPIFSIEAMNRSLDNDYGSTHGPNAATSHELALWVGDPLDDDSHEQDGPGYARGTIANNAAWAPAADAFKTPVDPILIGAPSGEWEEDSTHWVLFDGDDPDVAWDYGPLSDPLAVTGAGPSPEVLPTVYYNDSITEPE